MTLFLSSAGKANSLRGDGALTANPVSADKPDSFVYDPMSPVPSYGGNVCCTGNAVTGGALDQRNMEMRDDILVYTSEPLKEGIEVSGPIEPTLYVSSDAKDTDFTVKVIDVLPDGTAYNLDETIQRLRYRNGYDKPLVWMEPGKVYRVVLQPMTTSNYFAAGDRIRVEVSSSNFPRFDRNMNTGGNNYDEVKGVIAHNAVHHSRQYPSSITLTCREAYRLGRRDQQHQAIMDVFLQAAIEQAKAGLEGGGIPIGSVLVIDGRIVGRGLNKRVQEGNPVLHAEMDCLRNAGRLPASEYRRATLYSTLSPCDMCSGATLLYKIPRVVIGENRTFRGPEDYLRSRGVEIEIVDDAECVRLMREFIRDNPSLWNEDIGV